MLVTSFWKQFALFQGRIVTKLQTFNTMNRDVNPSYLKHPNKNLVHPNHLMSGVKTLKLRIEKSVVCNLSAI